MKKDAETAHQRFGLAALFSTVVFLILLITSVLIFLASVVLAALALVTKLGFIPMPRYLPHQEFWLAIIAYITLMIGNMVRGL